MFDMMYAEAVLEIWFHVGAGVLLVFFFIQGVRRAFRQNSRRTELRMLATVEAEKLRLKEGEREAGEQDGGTTQDAGKLR
jgi:hypothetical protein